MTTPTEPATRITILLPLLQRTGLTLLTVAALLILTAGFLLAVGQPRLHTLTTYLSVIFAAVGILLALPETFRNTDTLR